MPAKSKDQVEFFKLVKGVKNGDIPKSGVSKNIISIAKNMSTEKIDDFAETDPKNLPKEVKKEIKEFIIRNIIKEEIRKIRR